jgi:RimJ/RimL family protein N-acetyltransferase
MTQLGFSCDNRGVPVELLTDRLRLREWTNGDLEVLIEVFTKPEIWHYPLRRGFTPEETTSFLDRMIKAQDQHGIALLATEDRLTGQLLGYVGLSVPHFLPEIMPAVEIGWRLDPRVWGQGLATEGAVAVRDHAFSELNLEELVSIYEPDNVASGMVMKHLGMHFDRDTVDPERNIPLRVYRLSLLQWQGIH